MPDPRVGRSGRPDRAAAREPALSADPDLVARVGRLIDARSGDRPPVIGVVGAQGSGKTTLARAVAERFGACQISIDDVYLSRAGRQAMAREVHPLFTTRGPPGTHDLDRLGRVVRDLSTAGPDTDTALPGFDKRADDRLPPGAWRRFRGRPSAILIDGWCLGAPPAGADEPSGSLNALERDGDPDGRWRAAVEAFVAGPYAAFARSLDAMVHLEAPGFDVVLDWRCQQEADLLGVAADALPEDERQRLAGFIQYFERLTRRMLRRGVSADLTVKLDRNRLAVSVRG